MSTTISPTAPDQVQEDEGKKKRNRKPLYPLPEGTKIKVTPDDFDPDKHRLAKGSFEDTPCYMEHQAWIHEYRAKNLRKQAEDYRLNPPKPGAKRAALLARLGKLEAKLAELGVNVEDLFADEESAG